MTLESDNPLTPGELRRVRAMLDRNEIDECLASIARGADRFDRDLFLSGFHTDAMMSMNGESYSAADSFQRGRDFHDEFTLATMHCLSTVSCDIDGDLAHVETYHIYCARNRDDTRWMAAGRYLDRFERREGRWGIALRHVSVEWAGELVDKAIPLSAEEDAAAVRFASTRARDDASYRRPLEL